MEQRIESLKKQYESKILEADSNIKLILNTYKSGKLNPNTNDEKLIFDQRKDKSLL